MYSTSAVICPLGFVDAYLLRGCIALVLVLSGERGPLTIVSCTLCRPLARTTATNRQANTSVRCVASRSRSIATCASTATCTARPSMRMTSVVAASAGPPTSKVNARLAAGNWRLASNYRRMVKSEFCGDGYIFLGFVFDELVSCLNDREETNEMFRICLHGFICSFFLM